MNFTIINCTFHFSEAKEALAAARALLRVALTMLLSYHICNTTSGQCFLSKTSAGTLSPTELITLEIETSNEIKIRENNLSDLEKRLGTQAYQINSLTYFVSLSHLKTDLFFKIS